jgi:hypothetical protein
MEADYRTYIRSKLKVAGILYRCARGLEFPLKSTKSSERHLENITVRLAEAEKILNSLTQ